MRITTGMIHQSAKKAGIDLGRTSLLSYINRDSQTNLWDNLFGQSGSKVSSAKKTDYDKIKKTADSYESGAMKFLDAKEDSALKKAKEGGDYEELISDAKSMVSGYNTTLKALSGASDELTRYYGKMFAAEATDNKEALEAVGITASKSGSLSLDVERLKNADAQALETVFGTKSKFLAHTTYTANRAADNAQANAASYLAGYDAKGNVKYF